MEHTGVEANELYLAMTSGNFDEVKEMLKKYPKLYGYCLKRYHGCDEYGPIISRKPVFAYYAEYLSDNNLSGEVHKKIVDYLIEINTSSPAFALNFSIMCKWDDMFEKYLKQWKGSKEELSKIELFKRASKAMEKMIEEKFNEKEKKVETDEPEAMKKEKKVKLSESDELKREKEIKVDEPECCICFESRCDAYFSPCAHNSFCFRCSRDLKVCPICRIEGYAKQK